MKNITLILGILIALIVGGGIGYSFGKSTNDSGDKTKLLEDSIVMMREQSTNIQKMAEIMKSGGVTMQEFGITYKDDGVVSKGKDLEAIAEKYMRENTEASEGSGSMKH